MPCYLPFNLKGAAANRVIYMCKQVLMDITTWEKPGSRTSMNEHTDKKKEYKCILHTNLFIIFVLTHCLWSQL